MTIAQNFPAISPSLLLDFANVQALDSRITFTRATTATYYGTRTALAEQNLFERSQEFDNAYWSKNSTTVTANSIAAPDGTTTADTLSAAGTSVNAILRSILHNSGSITFSIYAKAGTKSVLQIDSAPLGAGVGRANFDLATGTLGTVDAAWTASMVNAGNGWYRCIATFTGNGVTGNFIISMQDSTTAAREATSTAGDLYLWGAQWEIRSTVTAYTPTTTQPVTNYIPVLETAASGVARFDHNPLTFESLGLLIEEQRTNLALQSEDFGTTWANTNSNDDLNVLIAPNGTLTADKIYSTTSNDGYVSQAVNIVSGTVYTSTIYAKAAGFSSFRVIQTAAGGDKFATFTLTGDGSTSLVTAGATATITSVGNGWYRCGITYTATSTGATGYRIYPQQFGATGDGYSGIYIWGAQLETGAFSTSYIPTVASQVTRAADSASMTGANFSSWFNQPEGTFYADYMMPTTSGNKNIFSANDNTALTRIDIYASNGNVNPRMYVRTNAVDQANILVTGSAVGTYGKVAGSYKVNDIAVSSNSGTVGTVSTAIIPFVNSFRIMNDYNGARPMNGYLRKLAYYPTRLTDTQLQALTT